MTVEGPTWGNPWETQGTLTGKAVAFLPFRLTSPPLSSFSSHSFTEALFHARISGRLMGRWCTDNKSRIVFQNAEVISEEQSSKDMNCVAPYGAELVLRETEWDVGPRGRR